VTAGCTALVAAHPRANGMKITARRPNEGNDRALEVALNGQSDRASVCTLLDHNGQRWILANEGFVRF
jgi:hypothetical protein